MYNHIYSIVEDFVKAVEQEKEYSIFLEHWNGKRGPKRRLSIAQVISLNLLRFTIHVKDLKAFHRIVYVKPSLKVLPITFPLHPAVQKLSGLFVVEFRNHLVEQVDEVAPAPSPLIPQLVYAGGKQ